MLPKHHRWARLLKQQSSITGNRLLTKESNFGDIEMETWRWRHGDGDMEMEIWKWRHGDGDMKMETWRHET